MAFPVTGAASAADPIEAPSSARVPIINVATYLAERSFNYWTLHNLAAPIQGYCMSAGACVARLNIHFQPSTVNPATLSRRCGAVSAGGSEREMKS